MRLSAHRLLPVPLALALLLGACGTGKHPYDATAENNGYYVQGGGVLYQLQISRELNQYSVEDHQYLAGLPTGSTPGANQLWYGVFLWAKNYSHHPASTADNFDIVDTQGNKYYPVQLNPAVNQYAWTGESLRPLGTEPGPDTTASFGPTQGALVLFKLPTAVYSNRPLTLEIRPPGTTQVSSISLDL